MKAERLISTLEQLLTQPWAVFIWGPPGVGKSAIVHQVAAKKGMPVVDLRASLLDPTDLRGIPAVIDGQAVWCPPSFLPKPEDKPGILFLDEINAAPPLVQAAMYQLVLDRRVGEYALPDGWRIVAAGNRQQDRAVTFRMSTALANRFIHLELEANMMSWRSWAQSAHVHPLVIAFLSVRSELLYNSEPQSQAFATPRSWEMLSDVVKTMGDAEKASDVLPGIVGVGPATEFLAFVRNAATEEQLFKIVESPLTAELPEKLDGLWLLITWLSNNARDPKFIKAIGVLLSRLKPEYATVLAKDAINMNPEFVFDEAYQRFINEHKTLFAASE